MRGGRGRGGRDSPAPTLILALPDPPPSPWGARACRGLGSEWRLGLGLLDVEPECGGAVSCSPVSGVAWVGVGVDAAQAPRVTSSALNLITKQTTFKTNLKLVPVRPLPRASQRRGPARPNPLRPGWNSSACGNAYNQIPLLLAGRQLRGGVFIFQTCETV